MRLILGMLLCAAPSWSAGREAALAKLDGAVVVTEGDLVDWQVAQACHGEGALATRQAGIVRLLETAVLEKALKGAGVRIVKGERDREAARIERETKAPDILACLKKALKGERYLKAFVEPTLVEAMLRRYLRADGPRGRAMAALAAARKGSLEKAAEEFGLAYSSASYASAGVEEERRFIEKSLKGLKPGALAGRPVETDDDFKAVRLLKSDGETWVFEAASALKLDQAEWLKGVPRMRLEILDEGLRAWVKKIRNNPRLAAADIE